jgi:hypothetical protein
MANLNLLNLVENMVTIAMVTILRMLKDSPTSLEMLAMLLLPKLAEAQRKGDRNGRGG